MADAIDDDTLRAAQALWRSDTQELPALLAEPPGAGKLKSPRERPLPLPYAAMSCEALPARTQRYTGGVRIDARKLRVEVWGTKEQATQALAAVLALFDSRLGATDGRTLVYPSGARFHKWWPLNDGELRQEDAARHGLDVWKAVVEGEVHSVRGEP